MIQQSPVRAGSDTWLVLIYQLKASRSSLKAWVRRQLTTAGALYPANAVAALPASPKAERLCRRLGKQIREADGSVLLLRAEEVEGAGEIVTLFNILRDQEYADLISGCQSIMTVIEKMRAAGHFSYAELAEKEAALRKLSLRAGTIRQRDVFRTAGDSAAISALARCRTELDLYSEQVYKADSGS